MRQRSSGSVKVFYPPWNREALLVRLREGVTALREVLPLVRVVLFGSYARGRQTVASDIDLLVIYAGEMRGDAYERSQGRGQRRGETELDSPVSRALRQSVRRRESHHRRQSG